MGRPIARTLIASSGVKPPLPPGLDRPLGPGELALSPRLRALLASSEGALLRPRYPGRIVATIQPDGLQYPGELRGYVGVSRPILRQGVVAVSFGPDRSTLGGGPPTSVGVWIVTLLVMLGFALPVLVLLHTATRLSARSRDARYSALRLIGATRGQVAASAAAEASLLALVGSLAATPVVLLVRGWVSGVLPQPYQWFPDDLALSPSAVATVTVGVTALSAGVTFASMNRVLMTPLGVIREPGRTLRKPRGIYLVLAGLVALLGASFLTTDSRLQLGVVAVGLVATPLGAIILVPWLGSALAAAIGRKTGRPGVLLGAHWLAGDPGSTGRIMAGSLAVVLVVGIGQAIALSTKASQLRLLPDWAAQADRTSLFVDVYRAGVPFVKTLRSVEGVKSVHPQPTGLFGETGHSYAVVRTDGSEDTQERIRNAFAWSVSASVSSGSDVKREILGSSQRVAVAVALAGEFGLLVIGAGFLITALDRMVTQRQPLAAVAAIGASSAILRAACFTQALIPVAVAVTGGGLLSMIVTALLFRVVDEKLALPIQTLGLAGAASALVVLLVTAVTQSRVRGIASPGSLRIE